MAVTQEDRLAKLLFALEQIAAGAKPVTKTQGSLADIDMAAIARDAIAECRQTQTVTPETAPTDSRPHQPTQTVSAASAHRLLGDFLAAQSVIQWLKDNGLLNSQEAPEALARSYAGTLKQQRDFLDQFDG